MANWPTVHGGGKETRTPDIQLAKLALYQLSYMPGMGSWDVHTSFDMGALNMVRPCSGVATMCLSKKAAGCTWSLDLVPGSADWQRKSCRKETSYELDR